MKKALFFLLILLAGCTNINNQNAADDDSPTNEVTESKGAPKSLKSLDYSKSPKSRKSQDSAQTLGKAQKEGVEMWLKGFIGGSPAKLGMDGLTGDFSYELDKNKIRRRLVLESWDKTTGRLLLRTYELKSDKYIGMFDGTLEFTNKEGEYTFFNYEGIFTNYKGAKTDFRLWCD